MAYSFDNSYYFRPYRGTGNYWLNRSGSGSISEHQKATLYDATGDPDQRLQVHQVTGGCQLLSDLNHAYGLNIYGSGAGSVCDFYPVSGNFNDALIDLLTVDGNNSLYRVNLIKHNLFLTPSSDSKNAALTWQSASGADNQVWQLCSTQNTGGGGSGGKINMPYNYNQKAGPTTNFKAAGCACTCGMDVAAFYDGKNYGFIDFMPYWDDNNMSYSWGTPNGYTFARDTTPSTLNEANTIAYIKRYIDAGIPPLCHCLPAGSSQHWVVPFTYNAGTGWDSIMVLDPYQGAQRTMSEAMRLSCGGTSGGVDRIMHHPNHNL